MAKSKRKPYPTGPMVPITDEDIKNLKFCLEAATSKTALAKWSGYSAHGITNWLKGESVEMTWRESIKRKFAKMAKELNPAVAAPAVAVRVPAFQGPGLAMKLADVAIKMRGQEHELDLLRLAVDAFREGA